MQAQLLALQAERDQDTRERENPPPQNPPPPRDHLPRVSPPSALKLNVEDKVETWKLWKQQWGNYVTLSELDKFDNKVQLAMFESCLGPTALRVYNQLPIYEEGITLKNILPAMESALVGEQNETYERYRFNMRSQQQGEIIENFITDLRYLAKTCGFCDCLQDSLIRDRIVMGVLDKDTQKQLLAMKDLTLKLCIDTCQAAEATAKRVQNIHSATGEVHGVNKTWKGKKTSSFSSSCTSSHKPKQRAAHASRECNFCDKVHEMKKSECPVCGKKCAKCGNFNHFASKCPGKQRK